MALLNKERKISVKKYQWLLIAIMISTILGYFFSMHTFQYLASLHGDSIVLFYLLYISLIFVIGTILFQFFNLKEKLGLQKVNNQPSWVWYLERGLLLTIPTLFFIYYLRFEKVGLGVGNLFSIAIILLVLIFIFNELKRHSYNNINLEFNNFAPDSVGKEEDKLGYKSAAENTSPEIMELEKKVNIIDKNF